MSCIYASMNWNAALAWLVRTTSAGRLVVMRWVKSNKDQRQAKGVPQLRRKFSSSLRLALDGFYVLDNLGAKQSAPTEALASMTEWTEPGWKQ